MCPFCPFCPLTSNGLFPFRGQKGHEGHLFSVILYYSGITLIFFVRIKRGRRRIIIGFITYLDVWSSI